jgi:cardiolipin synthase
VSVPAGPRTDKLSPLVRAFTRAAGSRASRGNRLALLVDGPAAYAAMHAQIASATRQIHLENYIIHDDAAGTGFAAALAERARAGVRVRVLYDWLGSWGTSRRFWHELRSAGVEVRAFGPPRLRDPLLIGSRDHRKVLVVDGERGVTGGLCIGNEWVGDAVAGRRPWRDTAVQVAGPAARALDDAFARAWCFADGTIPGDDAPVSAAPVNDSGASVQVVATEPGRERAGRAIDLMVAVTAERLWVTEAYLALSQRLYQSFIDAARDGVDVRLLLPGASDLRLIRNISRVGYRGLLRAGVRIWEWNGPMLHAKTMVSDGQWVRIGSSNLNPSSLLANWELDLFTDDSGLALALEDQFLQDLSESSEITLRPRRFPAIMGRPVPPRFDRSPTEDSPAPHQRTFRERRRQAIVRVSGLIRGARASLFGPLAVLLLVVAVLFAIFPVPMALAAVVLSGLGGIALLVRALGHRERG